MANWQLGQRTQAREWYGQAVEWMEAERLENAELLRFRAESEALLGLEPPAVAPLPPEAGGSG